MKNRISAFLLVFLFILTPFFSAAAAGTAAGGSYVIDETGSLGEEASASLNKQAAAASAACGVDLIVVLSDDCGGENTYGYCNTVYDRGKADSGYGENALVLVICENRSEYSYVGFGDLGLLTDDLFSRGFGAYNQAETYSAGISAYLSLASEYILYGEREIPSSRQKPRLADEADLLNADEESALLAKLDEISERQQCDVAVVTVSSLGGKTSQAFADDWFSYNGYGIGDAKDGILLLVAAEDRDWAMATHGFGITAFTDAGLSRISDSFRPKLSSADYSGAFSLFAGLCDQFLTQARTGTPYDAGNLPKEPLDPDAWIWWIGMSVPLGLLGAFFLMQRKKSLHQSVHGEREANLYIRPGSIQVSGGEDVFLYKTVTSSPRSSSSDSSSSGGSSTHESSSGSSFGGSSGKY